VNASRRWGLLSACTETRGRGPCFRACPGSRDGGMSQDVRFVLGLLLIPGVYILAGPVP
jgi:hypothetical protein